MCQMTVKERKTSSLVTQGENGPTVMKTYAIRETTSTEDYATLCNSFFNLNLACSFSAETLVKILNINILQIKIIEILVKRIQEDSLFIFHPRFFRSFLFSNNLRIWFLFPM